MMVVQHDAGTGGGEVRRWTLDVAHIGPLESLILLGLRVYWSTLAVRSYQMVSGM